MFTRDSRKLRLVLASVGSVTLLYVCLTAGMLQLAHAVEARYPVYPWRHEDYLRLLLPGMYEGKGHNRIWLAGGSDVRESLLYERFNEALPEMEAFQGGLSLGTFDDVLLSLDYVEKVYGAGAMPQVFVLGITPRFVANIPRGQSPLVAAIDRYSPYCRVEPTEHGTQLTPKLESESLLGLFRLLGKQQPRYRAAFAMLGDRLLVAAGLQSGFNRLLQTYQSPYKYHHLLPWPAQAIKGWLRDPDSFWFKTHRWDPASDRALIRRQFQRLLRVMERHGTRLYVVNIPEHPLNREAYSAGRYETYLRIVRESLGDTPFLDLRELLGPGEFYDAGHPTLPGAVRVTERVLEFIRNGRPGTDLVGRRG